MDNRQLLSWLKSQETIILNTHNTQSFFKEVAEYFSFIDKYEQLVPILSEIKEKQTRIDKELQIISKTFIEQVVKTKFSDIFLKREKQKLMDKGADLENIDDTYIYTDFLWSLSDKDNEHTRDLIKHLKTIEQYRKSGRRIALMEWNIQFLQILKEYQVNADKILLPFEQSIERAYIALYEVYLAWYRRIDIENDNRIRSELRSIGYMKKPDYLIAQMKKVKKGDGTSQYFKRDSFLTYFLKLNQHIIHKLNFNIQAISNQIIPLPSDYRWNEDKSVFIAGNTGYIPIMGKRKQLLKLLINKNRYGKAEKMDVLATKSNMTKERVRTSLNQINKRISAFGLVIIATKNGGYYLTMKNVTIT